MPLKINVPAPRFLVPLTLMLPEAVPEFIPSGEAVISVPVNVKLPVPLIAVVPASNVPAIEVLPFTVAICPLNESVVPVATVKFPQTVIALVSVFSPPPEIVTLP